MHRHAHTDTHTERKEDGEKEKAGNEEVVDEFG